MYCEEAKTRTIQIQCVAGQLEIPGLPNNTTGNLKQTKFYYMKVSLRWFNFIGMLV